MTTLLAALFGGWLIVREDVLCLFGVCKDIEFLALRHLLDELTPLVFYFYATIHRGSRYELWQESILRMAVVFIVQQRHNYNKAMLSVISDHIHHETVAPGWKSTFSSYMNVFSEKKVETFHSLLRMQCPSWTSAEQIIEIAHVLGARKFDHEFSSHFLEDTLRKRHKHNVALLAGKTANFLVTKFIELHGHPGQSKETPVARQRRKHFYLKTFNCTLDQRSLPLGFSTAKLPEQEFLCDSEDCAIENEEVALLSCGHSFHHLCLEEQSCRYCGPFLLHSIEKLSDTFNKGIATSQQVEEENNAEEDDDGEEDIENAVEDDWYTTVEFKQQLRASLKNLPSTPIRPQYVSAVQKKRLERHRQTIVRTDHGYSQTATRR